MRATAVGLMLALSASLPALGDAADAPDRNKEVILRCNELRNKGDLEGAAGCFADRITHQGQPVTRQVLLGVLKDIYTAFPDYHTEIHELVAADDLVIERSTVTGTHSGVAKGRHNGGMLVDIAPTFRRFEIQHIHWWKLRDGKVIAHYAGRDDLGLMRQLGLLSVVAQPAHEGSSTRE